MEERGETSWEESEKKRDKVEGVKGGCGRKHKKATEECCCMTTAPSAPWLQM